MLYNTLRQQYVSLLGVLIYKQELSKTDKLELSYIYLLLNRQHDADTLFFSIDWNTEKLSVFDEYFLCYMLFQRKDTAKAKEIAARNENSPILHLAQRFKAILKQIEECENAAFAFEEDEPPQKMPTILLTAEGGKIKLVYELVNAVDINYYPIDIEFLFTSNPLFAANNKQSAYYQQVIDKFSYIKPSFTESIDLPKEKNTFEKAIGDNFNNTNVMIEARSGQLVEYLPHFAHSFRVTFAKKQGKLRVTDSNNEAIPIAYVKVYMVVLSAFSFHKDGYTDLRGVFDYYTLPASPTLRTATSFAILIISQTHGSVIHVVPSPSVFCQQCDTKK